MATRIRNFVIILDGRGFEANTRNDGPLDWMIRLARAQLDERFNAKVDEWISEVKLPVARKVHSLAHEAEQEWLETGRDTVRSPKCGKYPDADSERHRASIECPCGYVRMGELTEILGWGADKIVSCLYKQIR